MSGPEAISIRYRPSESAWAMPASSSARWCRFGDQPAAECRTGQNADQRRQEVGRGHDAGRIAEPVAVEARGRAVGKHLAQPEQDHEGKHLDGAWPLQEIAQRSQECRLEACIEAGCGGLQHHAGGLGRCQRDSIPQASRAAMVSSATCQPARCDSQIAPEPDTSMAPRYPQT